MYAGSKCEGNNYVCEEEAKDMFQALSHPFKAGTDAWMEAKKLEQFRDDNHDANALQANTKPDQMISPIVRWVIINPSIICYTFFFLAKT